MSKKIAIGLTGSFGSGKSTALKIFKKLGYKTYSADEQVDKLYEDEKIQKEIKKIAPKAFSKKELSGSMAVLMFCIVAMSKCLSMQDL